MGRLSEFIEHSDLLDAVRKVLKRCNNILISGVSDNTTLAADVTISCLEHVTSSFLGQEEYTKELAAMIFPLLLIMPKSQSINLKALSSAKELKWPLYQKLASISTSGQKLAHKSTSALNADNVSVMAESFLANSDEYVQWFAGHCHDSELSKTLFFLIMLHALKKTHKDFGQFLALYESCLQRRSGKSQRQLGLEFLQQSQVEACWIEIAKDFLIRCMA